MAVFVAIIVLQEKKGENEYGKYYQYFFNCFVHGCYGVKILIYENRCQNYY